VKSHADLDVWKRAVDLAADVYKVTASFPAEEKFGLVSQMRRSAVSIASNIAEGAARTSRREFMQFLSIASGSASELGTQLIISRRVAIGDDHTLAQVEQNLFRVSQMIQGLLRSIKKQEGGR
jgi:four helix bundle protein